jgi:hypothetical protein
MPPRWEPALSRLFLFIPVLAAVVLSGCGSGAKDLDNASAQAALTKYVADKPLTSLIFLPKGLPADLLQPPHGSNVIPTAFPNNDIPLTPILVKKGWAVPHYRKQPLFGVYRQEYVITPAGQTAMAGWAKGGTFTTSRSRASALRRSRTSRRPTTRT